MNQNANIPTWVPDAVFYQIFPDRFANGNPASNPPNVQPWGSAPTAWGFQGGDLPGVISRLDYLADLGVNALYLNPIFYASSNHRYNTVDYYRVDPRLGTIQDFDRLIQEVHRRGMRLILDGVFNHCGRGFFAFNDLLENEARSAYADWFHVARFPLDAYGPGRARNYTAWWNLKSLPKFNTGNAEVRKYLLGVARYWIERGADGWRLDVPNEIDDDTFWAAFRSEVKRANPEAYLLGEIWEADPRWVGPGHFDGLMRYPLREALLDFVVRGQKTAGQFAARAEELLRIDPEHHAYAHYLLMGSHDTERLRTACGGNLDKVRLCLLFQFCYPGAPAIYYGDEVGLEGNDDPDNRRSFPWDPDKWDAGLRDFVRLLTATRHRLPQLRRGDFRVLEADDQLGLCAFSRILGPQAVLIVMNVSDSSRTLRVPLSMLPWKEGHAFQDALTGSRSATGSMGIELALAPLSGALLYSADL